MSRPRAVEDLGVARARADRRHADPPRRVSPPVAGPGAAAPPRPPALVEGRRGHDRGLQLAVALDGQQRPEQGHATDVVVGPVDRVDVPAHRRVAGLGAVLLADEAVVGEGREEPLADAALDRRVGLASRTCGRACVSMSRSRRKWARAISSASSQAAWATSSQPRSSASVPRRSPADQSGPNVAPLMPGSARRPGPRAARGRPRSRSTRRTPRPRHASRSRRDRAAGRRTRSSARPRSHSRRS